MSDLDSIKAILHSKKIDSANVKPYTGLHFNPNGDLILSTPSLDSYRANNDPLYPYEGNLSTRVPKQVDYRILSYNSLENRRYQSLRMKQPVPHYVTRIYDERFGSVVALRSQPSKTIRTDKDPGYQLILDSIPNQDQTMVSQRFNKLSPFVTENGNISNENVMVPEAAS